MDDADAGELQRLEEGLWRPETRFDEQWMRRVLHPEFLEIGRSGRVYDLAATLAAPAEPFETDLPLPGFTAVEVTAGVVLVNYVSRVRRAGAEGLRARRGSLWLRDESGWRLRFHQGTPV